MPVPMTKSNVPQGVALRWNVEKAANEFAVSKETLKKSLNSISAAPDRDGLYSTQQVCEALFGSMHVEKLKTQYQITERYRLENAITKANVLNRAELTRVFTELADALLQVVMSSELSRPAKEDFLKNLAGWPLLLDE